METLRNALARKRSDYVEALEKALSCAVRKLAAKREVERVVLFGSYAAGRADLFTDLDLLVIMRTDLGPVERTAKLYRELELGVDLDLLVYTPDEFETNRDRGFLRRALEGAKVLYEKRPQL